MTEAAQLSFTDKKGYYGLTVQPTYEQMLRSLKKEVRIPQPDRSAKSYALGMYRAILLPNARTWSTTTRAPISRRPQSEEQASRWRARTTLGTGRKNSTPT